MDYEKIMPLAVLWIVWGIAAVNIRSHYRTRTMSAYPRGGGSVDSYESQSYPTSPTDHPISYWALLTFYSLVATFVPIATLYVLFWA